MVYLDRSWNGNRVSKCVFPTTVCFCCTCFDGVKRWYRVILFHSYLDNKYKFGNHTVGTKYTYTDIPSRDCVALVKQKIDDPFFEIDLMKYAKTEGDGTVEIRELG